MIRERCARPSRTHHEAQSTKRRTTNSRRHYGFYIHHRLVSSTCTKHEHERINERLASCIVDGGFKSIGLDVSSTTFSSRRFLHAPVSSLHFARTFLALFTAFSSVPSHPLQQPMLFSLFPLLLMLSLLFLSLCLRTQLLSILSFSCFTHSFHAASCTFSPSIHARMFLFLALSRHPCTSYGILHSNNVCPPSLLPCCTWSSPLSQSHLAS